MLKALMERRAALKASLEALHTNAVDDKGEARSFTDAETAEFDSGLAELRKLDERIKELQEAEQREAAAAAHRAASGQGGTEERAGGAKVTDPPVYVADGSTGHAYFRDLARFRLEGRTDAAERLTRSSRAAADEKRALGNTNATGGSGGEFAPPAWMVDQWINLIRPGRITADLFPHHDVPVGVSSINFPRILTGTTTAVQSTQNTALSQTDLTTGFTQTGFATIGGKQVSSQQLLDQTAINFDQVILADLAADYGQRVGAQIFLGTGTGSGTNAVVNGLQNATIGSTQTWTQASPTAAGFYGQAGALLSAFLTKRLLPPNAWVMHPRRWYWLASAVDGNGRPLVVPNGQAFNVMATQGNAVSPAGLVGTFHGLPVYIDPQVPINLGAGTNQDVVYLLRTEDLALFESAPQVEVFRDTYADSLGILFRMYAYVGTILNRHTESLGVISGTGLVTPTFAS